MKLIVIALLLISGTVSAQNWYEISTPTSQHLNAVNFPSEDVGYIVGDSGTILKSINGGTTWDEVSYTGITAGGTFNPNNFVDVSFQNEQEGYITIENNTSFKTIDGGTTWTSFTSAVSNQCSPRSIFIMDNDHVFIGGAGCFEGPVIKEYNGGVWTSPTVNYVSWDTQEYVEDMDFYDDNLGLAALRSKNFLRTTDGGLTWDSIPSGIATGHLTSVVMVDNQVCYAGYDQNGGGFGVLTSTDGGLTWSEDVNSATFFYPTYNAVTASESGDAYAAGKPSNSTEGIIFETTDGISWDYETVDHPINGMTSYGSDITFGVGENGYVVVNTLPGSLEISEMSSINASTLPYPVPSLESVYLKVNQDEVKTLEAFTLSGRRVSVDSEYISNELVIDVSNWSAGTYILQVEMKDGSVRCNEISVK